MKKSSRSSRVKKPVSNSLDEMRPEYDFRDGVRNKYGKHFSTDVHVIFLDSKLAAAFPDAESVSRALRAYLKSRTKRPTA